MSTMQNKAAALTSKKDSAHDLALAFTKGLVIGMAQRMAITVVAYVAVFGVVAAVNAISAKNA